MPVLLRNCNFQFDGKVLKNHYNDCMFVCTYTWGFVYSTGSPKCCGVVPERLEMEGHLCYCSSTHLSADKAYA